MFLHRSTSTSTARPSGSAVPLWPATILIDDRKQADQPAASNCSGFVPVAVVPGTDNWMSSRPSSLRDWPASRPPVVCNLTVYCTFSMSSHDALPNCYAAGLHSIACRCSSFVRSQQKKGSQSIGQRYRPASSYELGTTAIATPAPLEFDQYLSMIDTGSGNEAPCSYCLCRKGF